MNGEPIISPWVFLIMDSLKELEDLLFCSILCCLAGIVIMFFCYIADEFSYETEATKKAVLMIKRFLITIFVIALTMVAIPSEATAYKMLAAKFVTYENVELAGDTVKESIDYIFEKANDLQNNNE